MNLLLDLGNSRLKWATGNSHRLSLGAPLAAASLSLPVLLETWQTLSKPERIAIASVGDRDALSLAQSAINTLWPRITPLQCQAQAQALGVTNAYSQPEKLGVDRWLSLIAAHHRYRAAVCIVDCGTAITLDLLAADGRHQGGMIAPGLTLMKQALTNNTQSLPFSLATFPRRLATETQAAIHSGVLTAAVGLINQVMAEQTGDVQLVLTGGDAELIAPHLAVAPIIAADLVLHGLALSVETAA